MSYTMIYFCKETYQNSVLSDLQNGYPNTYAIYWKRKLILHLANSTKITNKGKSVKNF